MVFFNLKINNVAKVKTLACGCQCQKAQKKLCSLGLVLLRRVGEGEGDGVVVEAQGGELYLGDGVGQ